MIRWSQGLEDWGRVDLFGCTIGGQAWRNGLLSDAVVVAWSRSPDRWRRRLALVCTVPLNSKPAAEAAHTGQAASLDQYSAQIEETLAGQKEDQELSRWLAQARQRNQVVFHDEAFQ